MFPGCLRIRISTWKYNDPDMLVVGKLGPGWGAKSHDSDLTADEQYAHISLWSILSAPLLLGCDMTAIDDFTLGLLTNPEVIAVNQDPLVAPATKLTVPNGQIWYKSYTMVPMHSASSRWIPTSFYGIRIKQ